MATNIINAFHEKRRFLFLTYEKHGYDAARDMVKNLKSPQWRNGLGAELLFYHKKGKRMKLEVLLDAGVKADFTGMVGRKMTNIDVTTNLAFKKASDYGEVIRKRGKPYVVALANLKTEEVELFPLRFPFCTSCGALAHYILYLVPSIVKSHSMSEISDDQRVVRYCSNCGEHEEETSFTYIIKHLASSRADLQDYAEESEMYKPRQVKRILDKENVRMVKFFEAESKLLLSGLAENTYVMTHPQDGDGYWAGEVHWKHPLAKDLDKEIDLHYETWA